MDGNYRDRDRVRESVALHWKLSISYEKRSQLLTKLHNAAVHLSIKSSPLSSPTSPGRSLPCPSPSYIPTAWTIKSNFDPRRLFQICRALGGCLSSLSPFRIINTIISTIPRHNRRQIGATALAPRLKGLRKRFLEEIFYLNQRTSPCSLPHPPFSFNHRHHPRLTGLTG